VRSKTSTERAMIPIQSPSSLTVYEAASRRKSGLLRGSVSRGSAISSRSSYFISAQLFLQMHKFRRICATNCPEIERFHDAAHNVAGFNDYGRGKEHGLPSLSISKQTASHRSAPDFERASRQGAPFLVFGAAIRRPAALPSNREGTDVGFLGEFGHAASPLADSLPTGLTFKFANSGNVNRRPRRRETERARELVDDPCQASFPVSRFQTKRCLSPDPPDWQ
jgi:hypothetical protein